MIIKDTALKEFRKALKDNDTNESKEQKKQDDSETTY